MCFYFWGSNTSLFSTPNSTPFEKKVMPNYTKLWAKIGNRLMNKAKIYRLIPAYVFLIAVIPTMKPLSE